MKKILFMYEFMDLGYEVIEHVGVECLAAYMASAGWEVDIINLTYETDPIATVKEFCPDVLGVSLTTPNVLKLMEFVQKIKDYNPDIKIVLGGVGASIEPERIILDYPFVDAVSIGEGDETILELAEKFEQNQSIDDIRGICYLKGNTPYRTEKRDLIIPIDILPELRHIAFQKYKDKKNQKYIALSSTRGCLGNCSFCARNFKNQHGPVVRNKSAEIILKEIENCVINFGIRRFSFLDQTFEDACPRGKERIERIADLIIEKGLDIVYTIHIRTENWKEEDLLLIRKMRNSGLIGIYPGVESSNAQTLKLFNKYARKEDHIRAIELFRKVGVAIDVGMIMFHPYATISQLEENCRFIEEMKLGHLAHIFFNRLLLFPHTDIVNRLRQDHLLISEPSYSNYEQAKHAYSYIDDHVEYIIDHVLTESYICDLGIHEIYILSIEWEIFLSLINLKLNVDKYREWIDELTEQYYTMKNYFQSVLVSTFESILDAGKMKNKMLTKSISHKENISEYYVKFSKYKLKLFKEIHKNDYEFINKFFNT